MGFGYGGPFRQGYPSSDNYDDDSNSSGSPPTTKITFKDVLCVGLIILGVLGVLASFFVPLVVVDPLYQNSSKVVLATLGGIILSILSLFIGIRMIRFL